MMHMDGSKPTGFIESTYSNGVEHPMPNDPLRCFYYEAHTGSYQSCVEYGYDYTGPYVPEEYDDGGSDGDDDWDWEWEDDEYDEDYACSDLEYDHENYTYTCTYDMWGNLDYCECILNVTCLRDIWVYSTNEEEFWSLFFANMWTVFVWFSIDDIVTFLFKGF